MPTGNHDQTAAERADLAVDGLPGRQQRLGHLLQRPPATRLRTRFTKGCPLPLPAKAERLQRAAGLLAAASRPEADSGSVQADGDPVQARRGRREIPHHRGVVAGDHQPVAGRKPAQPRVGFDQAGRVEDNRVNPLLLA